MDDSHHLAAVLQLKVSPKVCGNYASRRPWRQRGGENGRSSEFLPVYTMGWLLNRLLLLRPLRARGCLGTARPCGAQVSGARACSSTVSADGLEGPARRRSYWHYVRRLILGAPQPPYLHVCQVGDPVLRAVAAPVEPAQLANPELQRLVQRLVQVMRHRRCVGLSAPQLGVPLQVLALEFPEALFRACAPRLRELRQMEPFPLRVLVNPRLRVLDSRVVTFPEGCESVAGFLACVPRFQAVEISGADGRARGGWIILRSCPDSGGGSGTGAHGAVSAKLQRECRHVS